MKSFLKLSLAVAMVASLSACGVGVENDNAYSAQNRKDAKVLNDRFDLVKGVYEGTFTPAQLPPPAKSATPQKAQLLMYVVNVTEGANPDGTVKVRPALYARFQLVDVVAGTDYLPMTGNYDDLGKLSLTSVTSTAGTGGAAAGGTGNMYSISIVGEAGRDAASIDVSNTGGYWGHFDGTRTSTDAAAPIAGDNQEQRARLLKIYHQIEGIYQATVDSGRERVRVQITITIAEGGTGGQGASIPYLIGQYRRLDFPTGIGERTLAVNFDSLTGIISMNAVQGGGSVPGSSIYSGSGIWINGVLDMQTNDSRGPAGEFKASRKSIRD